MHNQLTQSDIKKMQEEIEHRKCVVRKELLEHVKEARAQGDLSENFEYYAAKKEKNRNESRIRYLERMIKTAKIVSEESNEDEIGLNNTVLLYFEEEKEVEEYKIVTTMREDILNNKISKESPLGKAIFGHKVGERVHVKVNEQYGYYVVIQKIEKTKEDESDTIRSF
ncbi:MAG TPA: transcription elongation factor GreA [Lachnospiraceae bacterium]|jgi:transcription elongation factor GreA|nr:transcription elongation factor GreA [Lachnospiraceae bacterium]HIS63604.1 transcription elongation factor GreA [Candidatus Scybalomonas excrementigallinarum]